MLALGDGAAVLFENLGEAVGKGLGWGAEMSWRAISTHS